MPKASQRLLMLVCLIFLGGSGSLLAQDEGVATNGLPSVDSETLLKRLRDRDAAFDNVSLRMTVRESRHINEETEYAVDQFARFKFGLPRTDPPASFPAPYDVTILSTRVLTLRGDEIMLSMTGLTDHHGHPQLPSALNLWRRRAGREIHISASSEGPSVESRDVAPDDVTLLTDHRMLFLLALGVGYGTRITQVETLECHHDGYQLKGAMRLWKDDITTCDITLDRDLIVRKATIHANVRGRETSFSIETEGRRGEPDNRAIARNSKYLRQTAAMLRDGVRIQDEQTEADWKIEVDDVKFDLSDDEYERLTKIDIDAAQ